MTICNNKCVTSHNIMIWYCFYGQTFTLLWLAKNVINLNCIAIFIYASGRSMFHNKTFYIPTLFTTVYYTKVKVYPHNMTQTVKCTKWFCDSPGANKKINKGRKVTLSRFVRPNCSCTGKRPGNHANRT